MYEGTQTEYLLFTKEELCTAAMLLKLNKTLGSDGTPEAKPAVPLLLLDVRNAFNTVKWTDILDTIETTYRLPPNFLRLLGEYLQKRNLTYGPRHRLVNVRVAQRLITDFDTWNIIYNSLLRLDIPLSTHFVIYAADIAAATVAQDNHLV
ncbi:hypothetical protein KM043_016492 [Ampulex compressa]|nr:hypothetical protein KM043_016492 [Ampulex compressa]